MSQAEFQSLAGQFLVAETELKDPNFEHRVVLIINHTPTGAFGLVINNPTTIRLSDAASTSVPAELRDYPLYIGGPVDREYLFVLHSGFVAGNRSPESVELQPAIIFEPSFRLISELFMTPNSDDAAVEVRFYSGYSGWSAGQLEIELVEGSWVVIPATTDLVFSRLPNSNWLEALRRKGGIHWVYAKTGYKPSMN
jgi:putative transcriptional regulator